MASIYKVKIGKQGRIVLPKQLRETCRISSGDEAVIIENGQELNIHFHKAIKDPLEDLMDISKQISIGMSAKELKEFEDKERFKDYLRKSEHHSP